MCRIGDFYEFFFDDAIQVSQLLGLMITHRWKYNGNSVPMCGVPQKIKNQTVARLIKLGKRIGIMDEIYHDNNNIERKLTQIITPGTIQEEEFFGSTDSNMIMGLEFLKNDVINILYIDISTGRYGFISSSYSELGLHLLSILPSEIIIKDYRFHNVQDFFINIEKQLSQILNIYKDICILLKYDAISSNIKHITRSIIKDTNHCFVNITEYVLQYIEHVSGSFPVIFQNVNFHSSVKMSEATLRNLEVIKSNHKSLLEHLDNTKTGFGKRMLKEMVVRASNDKYVIEQRLNAVESFLSNSDIRQKISDLLNQISDIERIVIRFSVNKHSRTDFIHIQNALRIISTIANHLCNSELYSIHFVKQISFASSKIIQISKHVSYIIASNVENNCIININSNTIIQQISTNIQNIARSIESLVLKYKNITKSKDLSIISKYGYGYVVEINTKNCNDIPNNWMPVSHRQTKALFVTIELQALTLEEKLLSERYTLLENEILCKMSDYIKTNANFLINVINNIAELDVMIGFAELADKNHYIKPTFSNNNSISIINGKHPILSSIIGEKFRGNDLHFDDKSKIAIIFGSNMSGKSTFLRQNALICLMAHIGSFVPCTTCNLSIIDSIFCRIGSGDDIYNAKSTFLVEMEEIADILNHATEKSLCIIDEIGRGTNNKDGILIARAFVKYIATHNKSNVLLSTHYEELNVLENEFECIKNFSTGDIDIIEDSILYDYRIFPGIRNKTSSIIYVARVAGIPESIISEILN